jgi:hypothetical protein
MYVKICVVDPDPVLFYLRIRDPDTGIGMGKKAGSWMNIPDHIS